MQLTSDQLLEFDRDGYRFIPSLLEPQEIKVLPDGVRQPYGTVRDVLVLSIFEDCQPL